CVSATVGWSCSPRSATTARSADSSRSVVPACTTSRTSGASAARAASGSPRAESGKTDGVPETGEKPARESTENVRKLVDRAQQGDRAALEELYLIHFDRIYSYLHVSVGSRLDAEDLTTQTFLK